MNYVNTDVPCTRIHGFRHFHPERGYPADRPRIFSVSAAGRRAVLPTSIQPLIVKYWRVAGPAWVNGRLGTYRYLDMHMRMAVASA